MTSPSVFALIATVIAALLFSWRCARRLHRVRSDARLHATLANASRHSARNSAPPQFSAVTSCSPAQAVTAELHTSGMREP